jgi:hypothetical protein
MALIVAVRRRFHVRINCLFGQVRLSTEPLPGFRFIESARTSRVSLDCQSALVLQATRISAGAHILTQLERLPQGARDSFFNLAAVPPCNDPRADPPLDHSPGQQAGRNCTTIPSGTQAPPVRAALNLEITEARPSNQQKRVPADDEGDPVAGAASDLTPSRRNRCRVFPCTLKDSNLQPTD